ncbi:MAG: TetR/AcrR family transcriptional regulator [Actinobacteria bacterium]|nr:TetR/AcrR family transcriptional regulator [Actinomycetota bacterium]
MSSETSTELEVSSVIDLTAPDRAPRKRLSAPERRREILEAARSVFLRRGLSGARTREIAEAAGVNEALLYQHFSSKEALFEAAVVEPMREILDAVAAAQSALPSVSTDIDMVRTFTRFYVREFLQIMSGVAPAMGVTMFADPGVGSAFFQQTFRPMIDLLAEVITQATEGIANPLATPDMIATMGMGACFTLAVDHHFRGVPLDLEKSADEIADVMLLGVAPR